MPFHRLALVLPIAFSATVHAQAETDWTVTPTSFTRIVDGVEVPLAMDTSRMACFQDGVVSPAVASIALEGHGLDLDTLVPSSSEGWMYVDALDSSRSVKDVVLSVKDLSASEKIDFVSPIFLAGTRSLPWVVTRDIIVSIEHGTGPQAMESLLKAIPGGVIQHDLGGMEGVMLIETDLDNAFEVLDLVQALEQRPEVRFAQTDAIWWTLPLGGVPNDPLWPQLWGLEQSNDMDMDALGAWDLTTGDPDILVAIFDDGLDQDHPDMNQIPGFNFTGNGSSGDHVTECDGHGTCVASCVSATLNNGVGSVGIAPTSRTIGMKIFNAVNFFGFCLGFLESQDSWTINGINQAVNSGARVTNSSWGGGGSSSGINAAFDSSRNAGLLHVGAAGNDGTSTISWPASHGSLIAVAALSSSGNRASFSTYGIGLFCSAPGEGIWCADAVGGAGFGTGDTVQIDGTSFAAPYVAGVAALVLSMDPSLSPSEVEDVLSSTCMDRGTSGYDTDYGWGFVNAQAACEAVDVETPCLGDTNADAVVDVTDVLNVISDYGPCASCSTDFDEDGVVGVNDILILLEAFGPCE
ncbi:MAG: S8 family serine peptidase [Phycisphaerales bacterium]|nr:S8 family serine peptidase [Phycisphaerales bacterium]